MEFTDKERFPHGKERIEGKVIALNKRGFGFIGSLKVPFTRIYFHWTYLIPETINFQQLKRNDPVDFILEKIGDGSYRALKIDVLEKLVDVSETPESLADSEKQTTPKPDGK